jgi:hypothetical protein
MHYVLNDGELLRRLMSYPDLGRSGTRHTVRSLAKAAGLSKSKISDMRNDRQQEGHRSTGRRDRGGRRRPAQGAFHGHSVSTSTDIDMEGKPPT